MNIAQEKAETVSQRRRCREKEQRIQSILEAAKKVFSEKGYLKATMEEIAWEAQVTKPTVYLYFSKKDDLFFSLMLPLMEEIQHRLKDVEFGLDSGNIKEGTILIKSLFQAYYLGYRRFPEIFKIIQLFQQQKLVQELAPEIMKALTDKGRMGYDIARRILTKSMEKGIIRKVNVYEMADAIWGSFVGIIQLEDIKSDELKNHKLKDGTLNFMVQLFADAMTIRT